MPYEFTYSVEEKIKEIEKGIIDFKASNYKEPKGTVISQFNSQNNIIDVAEQCNFTIVSQSSNQIRVKHPNTTSTTSGVIDTGLNVYFNHSGSFSESKSFTPAQMLCYTKFANDWGAFYKDLAKQGYKELQPTKEAFKTVKNKLNQELTTAVSESEKTKIIFSYCYDLQTLSNEAKQTFIKENCFNPELKKYFVTYLKLIDYKITYDKTLTIKSFVSERLPEILDYSDKHNKIILKAETGKGKTTAFIRDFHTCRPKHRLLILVPLTIILEQNKKEYKNKAIFLDGNSSKAEHKQAEQSIFVFATYEQGIKLLKTSYFDYVVIDEVHQLITANSFKRKVIAELTPLINDTKVIGLTGTPNSIFKSIGYKIINIDVANPTPVKVEVRYSNYSPFNIALS